MSESPVSDLGDMDAKSPKVAGVKLREIDNGSRFQGIAEKIAQDKFCHINYYYPGGREAFPMREDMRRVAKFYPYAKGGPLFVDDLVHKKDEPKISEKKEIMKKLGHRYLILKQGMTETDALEQIA